MLTPEPVASRSKPATREAARFSPRAAWSVAAVAPASHGPAAGMRPPQDTLGAQLARAVAVRAATAGEAPRRPAMMRKASSSGDADADLPMRMLVPPPSVPNALYDDPLMVKAKEQRLRSLWELRLAIVWGGVAETRAGQWTWRVGSPAERLSALERSAKAVARDLDAGERARFEKGIASARTHVLDAVESESPAAYEAPDMGREAVRAAVAAGLDTMAKLDALKVMRPVATAATRLTPEHAKLWADAVANPENANNEFIQRGAKLSVPQVVYVLKGLLSGIDLAYKLSDEKKRAALLYTLAEGCQEYDLSFRGGVHDVMIVVQAVEALFTAGGIFIYTSMRALGMAEDASIWFTAFTAAKPSTAKLPKLSLAKANYLTDLGWRIPLRTLSFATSALQLVHGLAVLLNSTSTDSERLEAYWEGALGIVGLAGAGAVGLNMAWLAGIAGPATVALLAAGLASYLARAKVRKDEIAYMTDYVQGLFGHLQAESALIAQQANALEQMLRIAESGQTSPTGAVAAETKRRTALHAEQLYGSMARVFADLDHIDLHTPKSIKDQFADVKRQAFAAKTPTQMLAAAATFLNAVRDLFRHVERTIARTLIELDRDRVAAGWSWRDPIKLLRGLHDDRAVREKAAATQQPPPAVSFEFQLGPVEVWPAPRSQ